MVSLEVTTCKQVLKFFHFFILQIREVACPYILHVQRKFKDITSTKENIL